MKIKFTNSHDFIEELSKDKDKIERNIVRVNYQNKPTKLSPNINHLFIIAQSCINGNIIEFEKYCGDLWGLNNENDQKTKDKADEVKSTLETALQEIGITDIRGGFIEHESISRNHNAGK